jgi:NH3-dependent NAD+ synthetase
MSIIVPGEVIKHTKAWLTTAVLKAQKNAFVVNVSGGLTSAVTLALSEQTGLDTFAVVFKIGDNDAYRKAKAVVDKSNSHLVEIDLTKNLADLNSQLEYLKSDNSDLHEGHAVAVNKMAALDQVAKLVSGIIVGAETRESNVLREYNKRGAGASDVSVLADFYMSEVKELAGHLGLDKNLSSGVSSVGLAYERIEELMRMGEEHFLSHNADGMDKLASIVKSISSEEHPLYKDLILLRDTEFKSRHKYNPNRIVNKMRGEFELGYLK